MGGKEDRLGGRLGEGVLRHAFSNTRTTKFYLLWKILNFCTILKEMLKFLKNSEKFIVKTIAFLKFIDYI